MINDIRQMTLLALVAFGLQFFAMGEAQALAVNDHIVVRNSGADTVNLSDGQGLSVRGTAAGTKQCEAVNGATGVITKGPTSADLAGTTYKWWRIRWDDSNINPSDKLNCSNSYEGWSAEASTSFTWLHDNGTPDWTLGDSVSVSDNSVDPGDRITIYATARNAGAAPARGVTIRYYLQKSSTDYFDLCTDDVPSRVAGESFSLSTKCTIDSSVIRGDRYYIGACLSLLSTESNKNNNCDTYTWVTINQSGAPDWTVDSVLVSPSTVGPGQSVTIYATARNSGTAAAAGTTMHYRWSDDPTISPSDMQLCTDSVSSRSAGGTDPLSETCTVPSSATRGTTYYIGACVEAVSGESSTLNNCSPGVPVIIPPNSAPSSVSSPVYGDLHVVTTLAACDNSCANGRSLWCFNQHQLPGHSSTGGIGQANDTYAWDTNLNCPSHDSDDGMPVYAVADGVVETSYGGSLNTDGTNGQVLIKHGSSGSYWWSGYLHMENKAVSNGDGVSKGQKIGEISNVSGTTTGAANHLHFVVYTGTNSASSLVSYDAAINARYTLTLTAIGNGTVTPTPAGVSCGTNCYGYDAGTSIQLSGSPDAGSSFSGWSGGGCSGTGNCQLTIQSNQSISATFSASGAGAPDWTVDSVLVSPSTVGPGQSVTIYATARNSGTAAAAGTTMHYRWSDDPTISPSDMQLCTDSVSSRSAGGTDPLSETCTVPSSATRGTTYYIGACVEAVSGESSTLNNCSPGVPVIIPPNSAPSSVSSPVYGDLHVVTTLAACDNSCANGRSSWCFNQHQLPGHSSTGGIGQANDTYAWDTNLNCPSHDSDDGMPVYAVADGVVETSYGGSLNTDGTNGQVLIKHGSSGSYWWSGYLHMENKAVSNGDGVSKGQKIGEISNVSGTATGAANHLHFVVYTGTNAASSLASYDAAINARYTLTLTAIGNGTVTPTPAGVSCGTNCYGYDAGTSIQLSGSPDAGSSLSGWSGGGCSGTGNCQLTIQSNQSISATFSASGAGAPDWTVDSVSVNPTIAAAGDNITIKAIARNSGTATAAETTMRYLWSTDTSISTADTELCTDRVTSRAAGETSPETATCPAPTSVTAGSTYYVGACVDTLNVESNTSNNCSQGVAIVGGAPDWTVDSVSVDPTTVAAGDRITINAIARNVGTTRAAETIMRYLWSTDASISTADTELCTDLVSSVATNLTSLESARCDVPPLATPSTYYIGACVDAVMGESSTSNNCSSGVTVTIDQSTALTCDNSCRLAIYSGNQSSYSLSGSCATGGAVSYSISLGSQSRTGTPSCATGTWDTGPLDLSALGEGDVTITVEQTGQASIYATVVKDTIAPVITATDRALTAQGIMTAAVVSATAADARDGTVQPTGVLRTTSNRLQPSRSFAAGARMRLPSGRHQITWTAQDTVGNVGTAQSVVDIHPLVAFAPSQRVGAPTSSANLSVEVPVRLSGNAPFYPVSIPYALSLSSNMSASDVVNVSPPNTITLSQGDLGAVTFDIKAGFSPSDGNAATVRLSLLSSGLSSQVALSPRNANHAVSVLPTGAANLKPTFHRLQLSQSNTTSKQVARDAGTVDVRAQARDPDGDALSFAFAVNGPLPNRSSALFSGQASGSDSASFAFSPAALELGKTYLLSLIITDADNASIHVAERFKVVALDDDRVSDQDMDGVPDASDYVDVPNAQPISSDPAEARMAQSPVGTQLRLGERAELAASSVALSTIGGSVSVGSDTFNIVDRSAVYDFEVLGGDSDVYRVVLPLSTPIPSNALYLKQDRAGNWARFDDSGADALASASAANGICPGPDEASSYGAGLLAGRDCLLLTLVDGGPNDADGFQNGQVADPGTVAVQTADTPPPVPNGGGVIDPWALLILLLLVTYCVQRYGGKRHLRRDTS